MSIYARLALIGLAIVACLAVYVLSGVRGHGISLQTVLAGIAAGVGLPVAISIIAAIHGLIRRRRRPVEFHGDQITGDLP